MIASALKSTFEKLVYVDGVYTSAFVDYVYMARVYSTVFDYKSVNVFSVHYC